MMPASSAPTQSRRASLAEAATNVVAGFALAIMVQRLVYPAFGIRISLADETAIAALFTLASLLRSFMIRRFFVAIAEHQAAERRRRAERLERLFATGRLR